MKIILLLWSFLFVIIGYGQEEKLDVKTIIKEAEAGSAVAQYNLGMLYILGAENFPQSATKAVKWWEKSAIQGQDLAQTRLGWAYENGIGTIVSYSKAVEWYQKASTQGNKEAQEYLGYCYLFAKGVEEDPTKAFHLFEKASQDDEFGESREGAQAGLGYCYKTGKGVSKDDEKANYWFGKACERGVDQACKILSMK